MRIIGIVGIMDDDYSARMWDHLGPALQAHYPGATVEVARADYQFWQASAMRAFALRIAAAHDSGEDVLLVGHSMGGIVAAAAATRFRKSRVVGVVTLFAPHRFLRGVFSKMLRCEALDGIPIVTFGAWIDILSAWGNRHQDSLCHTRLLTDHHHGLVKSRRLADKIAATVVAHIRPSAPR